MEPLMLFATSVGLTAVFHLISKAVDTVPKTRRTGKTGARSDWYCFFKMSDLIGKNINANEKKDTLSNNTYDTNIEQRRRQQAQRPRLQA